MRNYLKGMWCLYLLVSSPVFAQSVQLTGPGGAQLMNYAHMIVNLVFWFLTIGMFCIGGFAAWKLTHDREGFQHIKMWVIGVVVFWAISAVMEYIMGSAQSSGMNSQNYPF